MRAKIFQVDAFTDRRFAGNPAAVVPLDRWPESDETLQAVAAENNLSETAFLVPREGEYELRWLTPAAEVDLCGHATLAAAWVVLRITEGTRRSVRFRTRSGTLTVTREGERLRMDFPALPAAPARPPSALLEGLGRPPGTVLAAADYLAVYGSESEVRGLTPDFRRLAEADRRGVIVTALSDDEDADFVSRFFAPRLGVPEDPVTGSAHCTLAPYWAGRLGRPRLTGRQLSERGGTVQCEVDDDRVILSGRAVLYLEGTIRI